MADPVEFVVKKLPYDLSSHGGLALVGRLVKPHIWSFFDFQTVLCSALVVPRSRLEVV